MPEPTLDPLERFAKEANDTVIAASQGQYGKDYTSAQLEAELNGIRDKQWPMWSAYADKDNVPISSPQMVEVERMIAEGIAYYEDHKPA